MGEPLHTSGIVIAHRDSKVSEMRPAVVEERRHQIADAGGPRFGDASEVVERRHDRRVERSRGGPLLFWHGHRLVGRPGAVNHGEETGDVERLGQIVGSAVRSQPLHLAGSGVRAQHDDGRSRCPGLSSQSCQHLLAGHVG